MVRDGKDDYNYDIYKITTDNKQLDITKIVIIVLLIVVIIGLILIAKNSIELMNQHKAYEQYEAQLTALKKQKEEEQAKIEAEQERIKQERMPQLTEERKKQYGKLVSFRNEKSISYL